jgi:hypothetical protein
VLDVHQTPPTRLRPTRCTPAPAVDDYVEVGIISMLADRCLVGWLFGEDRPA